MEETVIQQQRQKCVKGKGKVEEHGLLAFLFSFFTCQSPRNTRRRRRRRIKQKKAPLSDEDRKKTHLSDEDTAEEEETEDEVEAAKPPLPPPLPPLGPLDEFVPKLSQPSSLLSSPQLRALLHSALPTLARNRHWHLLYSTQRDGISLQSLYRSSSSSSNTGYCLLAANDFDGSSSVFGALLSAPLRPSSSKKYQGDSSAFVFTTVSGIPHLFRTTGANRYYVLCTNEALALGGGGHFALYIDNDLQSGSSGESETFGNTCLASADEFKLKHVELWGFH